MYIIAIINPKISVTGEVTGENSIFHSLNNRIGYMQQFFDKPNHNASRFIIF